jgi:hypothetical protein
MDRLSKVYGDDGLRNHIHGFGYFCRFDMQYLVNLA